MTVTIKKVGGSVALIIPKSIAAEMDLAEGTSVDLSTEEGEMVVRKSHKRRPRRSMSELISQLDPKSYRRRNKELAGLDQPVGKEI